MADWSRAVVLTASAFQVCWELSGLGETPWQLDPPRIGRTVADRHDVVAATVADLAGRGLGGRSGPRADLVGRLRILADPEWSVDLRLRADALVAGVGACRGARGVLAVRHAGEIALLDVPAIGPIPAVLDLLGPVSAGPGGTVRHPGGASDDAAGDDVERLTDMCRDVLMFGQLGATVTAHDGTRTVRRPRVVGFHRTIRGDYQTTQDGRGGCTVTPATRAGLLAAVERLVAAQ